MRSSGHLPLVAIVRCIVFSTSPGPMGAILTGGIGTLALGSILGGVWTVPTLAEVGIRAWEHLVLELLTSCGR